MTLTTTIIAIFCMGAITFILRAFPTLVPKHLLQSPILIALNFALPMSVMMVLILNSLSLSQEHLDLLRIAAEVLALIMVLLSYIKWNNVFISVIIGIAALNGFIWVFNFLTN